jgi:hypothetical protein
VWFLFGFLFGLLFGLLFLPFEFGCLLVGFFNFDEVAGLISGGGVWG